jgi:hypothetical protein
MRTPLGVVTVTGPVVAPFGTLVMISVFDTTLNLAGVLLKLTPVAPVRLVPRSTMFDFTTPDVGRGSTNGPSPTFTLKIVPQPNVQVKLSIPP